MISRPLEMEPRSTEQVYTWPNMRGQERRAVAPPVEDVKAEAREAGFAKGQAEGLEAGLAEGRRQAAKEFETLRSAVMELKSSLENRSRGLDEESAAAVADFVLQSFEALVGASARISPEDFAGLITQARQAAGGDERLRIEAHPELAAALTDKAGIVVEANPALKPGTLIANTPGGDWSASLFTEFRQLLEQALAAGH